VTFVDDLRFVFECGGLPEWWQILVAMLGALIALWLLILAALWRGNPSDEDTLRESLRLIPDVLRLVKRLAGDSGLPRGIRIRLALLLGYLALPIDLVPDFIPVIGYADDVLAVAIVLRSVVRIAGPEALERHWPGTPDGLRIVRRLAKV
jgi:uncharacterized membrane protein YkvA (DUF1232 family)